MAEENHSTRPPRHGAGRLSTLIDNTGSYIETKFDLFKVEAEIKATEIVFAMVKGVVLMFASIFTMFFLCVGIAVLLNELTNTSYLGYIIVGILLALFVVIILSPQSSLFTKFIKGKIQQVISPKNKDENQDED